MALSILESLDPTNPILTFYKQKDKEKKEKKEKKRKAAKKRRKIFLLILASLILFAVLSISLELNDWLSLIIVIIANVVFYKWAFIKEKIINAIKK